MYQTIVQEVQNNQIAPVYLLWGPNRYFIDRTITLLREAVAEGGSDAFNVEVLDALACTPGEVAETAGTLPFWLHVK
jgi:DNA polymerase III delta subunit